MHTLSLVGVSEKMLRISDIAVYFSGRRVIAVASTQLA